MLKFKNTSIAFAVIALLAGCGGGGGGTAATPPPVVSTPTPPPAPTIIPANIQTSVAALTYASGSPEFSFVSALNQFRAQVGLGLLAQSALLDKSAQNHLKYVIANDAANGGSVNMRSNDTATGRSMFHIESAGNPFFTGVQELDRAKVVGYTGAYVGEELAFGGGKGGDAAVASLTSTIYHRAGLMIQGIRDVGVAVGQDGSQSFTVEFGYTEPQSNASDFVGVYPADNQLGVGFSAGVETPNPFPELSTSNADFPTKTGYPVSVLSKDNTTLEVLTFTLTEAGSSTPLAARILKKDNDPNKYLSANAAFLVANAALKPNTLYTASFSGRVNNVLVTKSWKFTTKI
jgi:uncharacterized protein YkwD